MERRYWIYGPFEIPRSGIPSEVDKAELSEFWRIVEQVDYGLSTATGCYVFGLRAALGARPWYVGQAKVSFRQECFTPHKLNHYNSVIGDRKGTPLLFLVARTTLLRGTFVNKLGRREADWVENLLIRQCLIANKSLLNVSGTAFAKEIVIPGLFRPGKGKPSPEVRKFKKLLSVD